MTADVDSLEPWLRTRLCGRDAGVLVDVGAYRGDFTKEMLAAHCFARAHLFEPNPENFAPLNADFRDNPRVTCHPVAVGAAGGETDFASSADAATGSTLPYLAKAGDLQRWRVPQITLDEWWRQNPEAPVTLVKIDTQGADLMVLKGARELVASQRPWIVAELIFVPLYHNQAQPSDVLLWAQTHGYTVAGLFNEHFTPEGWLAFGDVVLAPQPVAVDPQGPFPIRPATTVLQNEIAELRRVCAERLDLIEYLHAEAEKRLRIIETLNRQLNPPAGS